MGTRRVRAVPDGGRLSFRRATGSFSSPAFSTRQTNRDNDFRVTINQAMIVATGSSVQVISPLTETVRPSTGALSEDSTCYGCHKNLDTMRSGF